MLRFLFIRHPYALRVVLFMLSSISTKSGLRFPGFSIIQLQNKKRTRRESGSLQRPKARFHYDLHGRFYC
jgi:hypothetical protein